MIRPTRYILATFACLLCMNALALQQDTAGAAIERAAGDEATDIDAEMRAAEIRLEEAARRIAELSMRQLPSPGGRQWAFAFSDRPILGITIEGAGNAGAVEGVAIRGVSPGGAAFEAGLRAGDVITSINDESMGADSSAAANEKLLAFMSGVEPGDTLDVEYLRAGNVATVALQPRAGGGNHFAFGMPGRAPGAPGAPHAPFPHMAPGAPGVQHFIDIRRDMGWRDMELVPLTSDLGKYFGTETGLLVVRAPADGELQLKDGDVIRSIDGREPASISHAVRILGSYQPGEKIKLEIMRDKRRRTLEVEIPDDRQSRLLHGTAPVVRKVRRHRIVN